MKVYTRGKGPVDRIEKGSHARALRCGGAQWALNREVPPGGQDCGSKGLLSECARCTRKRGLWGAEPNPDT